MITIQNIYRNVKPVWHIHIYSIMEGETNSMIHSNKELVTKAVDDNQEKIITLSDRIFEFAETGFKEFRSAGLFEEMLQKEGFTVTKGISEMPTAFSAAFGSGKPVIGLLAEYDALPG